MSTRNHKAEQVVGMLRGAEVLNSKRQSIGETCRELGIPENTYYRWRREHGGLKVSQAKRMKELEKENSRLRKAEPSR